MYAKSLVTLPDELGDEEAPLACGGLTAYGAVKKLLEHHVLPGRPIAIIGAAGGLGHYAVQIAKAFGYQVVGIDVGEERLDFVKSLGADYAVERRRRRSTPCRPSSAASTPAWSSRREWPGFRLGFELLGPHGLFVAVGLPPTERGQPRVQPVRAVHEGPDHHLLGGRHRAGHARAGRTRRRGQGEEPRVAHRRGSRSWATSSTSSQASKYLGRAVLTDLAN